jgi:hypothetical protein
MPEEGDICSAVRGCSRFRRSPLGQVPNDGTLLLLDRLFGTLLITIFGTVAEQWDDDG